MITGTAVSAPLSDMRHLRGKPQGPERMASCSTSRGTVEPVEGRHEVTNIPALLRPALGPQVGERLVVRGYEDEDAGAVFAAITESTDHLELWVPWYNTHRTPSDVLMYIRRTQVEAASREAFQMGMFLPSGRYLGGCALHVQNWDSAAFSVGYWIRQSETGRGYVTEAVSLLVAAAFRDLDAARLSLQCDARNHRSAAVAERTGFVLEGRSRHSRRATDGSLADSLHYGLVREDYEKRWPAERDVVPERA
jgi:ribosomal-protein-serine acetyltransferase